jgi:hypothetical protein
MSPSRSSRRSRPSRYGASGWRRSKSRLPERRRIPVEIVLFGLATAALAGADEPGLAVAFGAAAAVNTTLVHLLGEI